MPPMIPIINNAFVVSLTNIMQKATVQFELSRQLTTKGLEKVCSAITQAFFANRLYSSLLP
jgi:hypothetical protein